LATSKQLTAKVKLDVTDAESKLRRLESRIKSIQKVLNNTSNRTGIEAQVTKAAIQSEKLATAIAKTATQEQKLATEAAKTAVQQQKISTEVAKTATQQEKLNLAALKTKQQQDKVNAAYEKASQKVTEVETKTSRITNNLSKWGDSVQAAVSKLNPANHLFGSIWGYVKKIFGALVGVGTIRVAIQGADQLTGSENRLNNIAGKLLGDSAYTYDSSGSKIGYSQAALNFTKEAQDKMYAAAKNSRSSYSDMMANVSKTMTLAGDAFDQSIDKAIRFQEIMTKSYAVGGASAAEMSTSMYQLTQALGSGTLQGDELRSVREGAPLAYQAIEKFAQGVLNTESSLKDLASQGKITSEMVVAAVMNMGSEIDQAFALTKWRFSEVWASIKSAGQKALQPVVTMLTEMLNNAVEGGLIEKAEQVLTEVAKGAMVLLKVTEKIANFIKYEVVPSWEKFKHIAVGALVAIIAYTAALKTASIAAAVAQSISWAMQHKAAFKTIATMMVLYMAIAAILYILYLWQQGVIKLTDVIVACLGVVAVALLALAAIFLSVPLLIAAAVIGVLALLVGLFFKFTGEILGYLFGMKATFEAVWQNIGIAFSNMLAGMRAWWYNFIADMCSDFDWLLSAINSVAKFFGKDTITVEGLRGKAAAEEAKIQEYVDVNAAYDAAYANGFTYGEGVRDKINNFGEGLKANTKTNLGEGDIAGKLGLTDKFANMGNFPTGTNYDDVLNDIEYNTGTMADSMELADEDLDYLRKLASQGWTNKFTTAKISLDVTNNNNINSELDIFGIMDKMNDVLYEEMDYVANGVYG